MLISRYDAKDKAKEIMYSILDDTDYNDIESMAHALLMMKIKILKMFDEFPSADMVSREDFEPVDNKLYLNPVCRNCKHSGYCNNIPIDENNEDIEHYDAYGRPTLSVRECKNYEPENNPQSHIYLTSNADWIPITTSEPTTAHRVLVTYNWGDDDYDDYEVSDLDYWVAKSAAEEGNKQCQMFIDHVIAWSFMPQPYREREKERNV